MGKNIEPQLEQLIVQLDEAEVKELQLFVEFLLSKKGAMTGGKKKKLKRGFLEDMEEIPIPLDNIIIDRAEIYANRG
jgi:hypothetical protein